MWFSNNSGATNVGAHGLPAAAMVVLLGMGGADVIVWVHDSATKAGADGPTHETSTAIARGIALISRRCTP
jgi:hypothetical protein